MSHVLLFFCLKKVLLYELNNLNNFNENLSPHICTQNSTKEVYKYNYIYEPTLKSLAPDNSLTFS